MTSPDHLLEQAIDHHRSGRLDRAAELYREILQIEPTQTDALYLLGLIAHQSGDHSRAIDLIRQSLALQRDQPQCYNVLGLALMELDRLDEAAEAFATAIAAQPAPEFYNNLGNLRKQQGRLDDAIAAYTEAVSRNPSYADAHYNLGNAERAAGHSEAAESSFRRAIDIELNHANALAALGQLLLASGRATDAIPFLERAISLVRNDAALFCDLGDALQILGRRQEAVARYQNAIRADPTLARPWFAAGCAEKDQQDYASAMLCFRKALELHPDWPVAHHNLADALFNLGQVDEALIHFREAARSGPPELPRAMIAVVIPGAPSAGNREILEARREFATHHLPSARPRARFERHQPLRIGYVSSFFQHDNWMKPVWGLINHHDRFRFEVHLFSDAPESAILHGYRRHPADGFHDITGLSNEQAADCIQQAEIDLLIDLNGYSKMPRLSIFALRPAPVIAAWFNTYATSGMECFDHLIGDADVIPPEDEHFYSERVLRVPGSYLTFEVAYAVPDVTPPPCQSTGAITFGCLASQYKITSDVVAAWSRILRDAPASRMVVRNSALGSAGVREFLQAQFESHGIPADRVALYGPGDHFKFLQTYNHIDIALDTFPYNGGTTTTEAIWQGVPVIAFHGDRWVARTSASILRAGGLGEFVCRSLEDYLALAVRLANSADTPAYLTDLRRNLRARLLASPVCDTASFAREMEQLYARIAGI